MTAFETPVPVAGTDLNTDFIEESMRLSSDELVAYFDSNRGSGAGQYDIYVASRSTRSAPFGASKLIDGLRRPNGSANYPSISNDALHLFYEGDCWLVTEFGQLCEATRTSVSSAFANVTAVTSELPGDPFVDGDGLAVYFSGSHVAPIVVATRNNDGSPFGGPKPITIQTLTDAEANMVGVPVPSVDGARLYFALFDPPHIYVASRVGEREFGNATPLHSLDSASGEKPTWISPDGCRLYLT